MTQVDFLEEYILYFKQHTSSLAISVFHHTLKLLLFTNYT